MVLYLNGQWCRVNQTTGLDMMLSPSGPDQSIFLLVTVNMRGKGYINSDQCRKMVVIFTSKHWCRKWWDLPGMMRAVLHPGLLWNLVIGPDKKNQKTSKQTPFIYIKPFSFVVFSVMAPPKRNWIQNGHWSLLTTSHGRKIPGKLFGQKYLPFG